MVTDDHVAYIPNISNYMSSVFDHNVPSNAKNRSEKVESIKHRRCPYCFMPLRSVDALKSHVRQGLCFRGMPQPSVVRLPEKGSVLRHTDLTKSEAPILTMVMDSESRLVTESHRM